MIHRTTTSSSSYFAYLHKLTCKHPSDRDSFVRNQKDTSNTEYIIRISHHVPQAIQLQTAWWQHVFGKRFRSGFNGFDGVNCRNGATDLQYATGCNCGTVWATPSKFLFHLLNCSLVDTAAVLHRTEICWLEQLQAELNGWQAGKLC